MSGVVMTGSGMTGSGMTGEGTAPGGITVVVNGDPRRVDEGLTIEALVPLVTNSSRGIAVAWNDAVVPRAAWEGSRLADGDRVEVLTAVQGG